MTAFERDPERVWEFYALRYRALLDARPNRGHTALAELERMGLVRAIVTQNIDLLHTRAGSRDVVEVHGSIRTATCPACGTTLGLEEVVERLELGGGAPRCPSCRAVVKPDVVFFEELLPESAIDRAYELARQARLLLVVGSSLEVHPVAGLPEVTRRAGGAVAILNRGPTMLDPLAALRIDGAAGEVLEQAVSLLR